ncbi:MAG: hypothetical protein EAY81_04060 [Bacteroidetes bacterium]|nr:MAG: hypothetical protein EAY81_04060 [Bacteroidota bacterium]
MGCEDKKRFLRENIYYCVEQNMDLILLKQQIITACKTLLEQRIEHATTAMNSAQESANSEDKSSAGDKYETSRAMGQLDRDMNAKQLAIAKEELNELLKINPDTPCQYVSKGALVQSNQLYFFVATGIGVIKVADLSIGVVSPESPIAKNAWHKKVGDQITVAGKPHTILAIV